MAGRIRRLGVIRNPEASRNQRSDWKLAASLKRDPDLIQAEVSSASEISGVLKDFLAREVDLVVVDGGDGTLHKVLSAFPGTLNGDSPAIAIIPRGKTNLAARNVGAWDRTSGAVDRLRDKARNGGLRFGNRRVLRIAWPDGAHAPVRGLLFGAGAFTYGTLLAQKDVHSRGFTQAPAVALVIADFLLRTAVGRRARLVREGWRIAPEFDGLGGPRGPRFLLLASTLDRLVMGMRPFRGEGGELNWLDILAPAKCLCMAILPLATGRPRAWMEEAGYRRGGASRLNVEIDSAFVVDGEVFEPGPSGRIEITAGETVRFVKG